jgi:hypothetical protein
MMCRQTSFPRPWPDHLQPVIVEIGGAALLASRGGQTPRRAWQIGECTRQPVGLVNDDHIDLTRLDIGDQSFQGYGSVAMMAVTAAN